MEGTRVLTDHELSMTVDAIFLDDDRNNDGYIDYSEFASSQTRNQNNGGPPPPAQELIDKTLVEFRKKKYDVFLLSCVSAVHSTNLKDFF